MSAEYTRHFSVDEYEIPLSPSASTGSFATEPNAGLYAGNEWHLRCGNARARWKSTDTIAREGNSDGGVGGGSRDADDGVGGGEQSGERPAVKEKLDTLDKRHASLLVLSGVREERIGKLTADLADVREIYNEQLNELTSRLGSGGKV